MAPTTRRKREKASLSAGVQEEHPDPCACGECDSGTGHIDRAKAQLELAALFERYVYKTPEDRAWWDEWRATRFCGRAEPWELQTQLEMFT